MTDNFLVCGSVILGNVCVYVCIYINMRVIKNLIGQSCQFLTPNSDSVMGIKMFMKHWWRKF